MKVWLTMDNQPKPEYAHIQIWSTEPEWVPTGCDEPTECGEWKCGMLIGSIQGVGSAFSLQPGHKIQATIQSKLKEVL